MNDCLRRLVWPCVLLNLYSAPSAANDPERLDADLSVVLTPSRLRQSLADTPASVTVITSDMIQRYGIASIPEALRLVPGMAVTQATGNDYRINYHGTNILVPRRMNVLIDGLSVYRPALAQVDWKELPVALEDVDRIEVTRGPNSVAYGANSMLAVVNIITQHPRDVEGTTITATRGSQGTANGTARYSGKLGESTSYRITLDHQHDTGYNDASSLGQGHDSSRFSTLSWRSVTDLGPHDSLDLQAMVLSGVREVEFSTRTQQSFPDIDVRDYYLNARWHRNIAPNHELQLQLYMTQHRNDQDLTDCLPTIAFLPELFTMWRANPAYVRTLLAGRLPAGGSPSDDALAKAVLTAFRALGARANVPTCANSNQDYLERRYDVELQDTYVFSDSLRMVGGLGLRRDLGDSQTYLGGRVVNNGWRIFANAEYKPTDFLNINAGGFFEADTVTGRSFSPRIAFNGHITDHHTVRFILSKAVRMPDLLEQRADWRYAATNFQPTLAGKADGFFYASAQAPGNLRAEEIVSRELGYLGNFPEYGLLVDGKLFDDRLTHLISQKLQVFDFSPTNDNAARLRGTEWQISYHPDQRWSFNLGYSYLLNSATTILEQTQHARHSGSFGVSHDFGAGWRTAFSYYGYGAVGVGESGYGREDLTISKHLRWGPDFNVTTAFTIRHLDNPSTTIFNDFGLTRESRYTGTMQYSLTLRLTL